MQMIKILRNIFCTEYKRVYVYHLDNHSRAIYDCAFDTFATVLNFLLKSVSVPEMKKAGSKFIFFCVLSVVIVI